MANTLNLGNGNWAQKTEKLLGYNAENDNYKPLPFDFDRSTVATRVNKQGLIETVATDEPRIDFLNNTKGRLLLEPTRTNSITYSEDFSDSSWNKNNTTVTSNNTTAPDGSSSADLITSTGTTPYARATFTHSTLTSYSVSIFGKMGDEDYLYIRALALSSQPIASFNLSTGSLGTVNSGLTAEMQNYGNGWYRCIIKYTTTGSIANDLIDFGFASSDNSRFSSSGKFTYFWGAQIETGSYPTSYIPTSGSTFTRTADSCKLENFANAPTDYPFTVFWEGRVDDISTNQNPFSILDASSSVKYLSFSFANTGFFQVLRRNVDYDIDSETFSISVGDVLKIAIAFTSNTTYKCYINGSLERNETSGLDVDFDFNNILIGQLRVVSDTGTRNQASQLMIFNEALTDAELIALTS